MSIEELAAVRTGRLAPFSRAASVLQVSPDFLEKLPLAIYACDAEGNILWFNGRAAELWGREPRIGDDSDRYCGSYKLYFNDRQITRDETPWLSS